jgi:hypothetical protein
MAQAFEDWLVELHDKNDYSILEKLPGYLTDHYVRTPYNVVVERERLFTAFREKVAVTPLSGRMLDIILTSH